MPMPKEEPDWSDEPILPDQFWSSPTDDGPMRGIRMLMAAVLEDAIHCILEGTRPKSNARARIRAGASLRWMRAADTTHAFSFESICDVLELDREHMRQLVSDRVQGQEADSRTPRASFHRVERISATIRPRRQRRRRGAGAAAGQDQSAGARAVEPPDEPIAAVGG